jgi:anti-sigma regulatory factor (Ser/Thr protein kinase)
VLEILRIGFRNGDPASPLRQAAYAALHRIGNATGEAIEDALLVVSELVQNVSQHTGSDGVLTVDLVSGDALIEVTDADPTPPRLLRPDGQRIGGRGLLLVAGIADAWGVRSRADGKTVWARMPLAPAGALVAS